MNLLNLTFAILGFGGTFDFVMIPAQKDAVFIDNLAASTSSTEQAFAPNEMIAINATKDITIKFGAAGLGAADANDFRIPVNQTQVFDLGRQWTSIRVFNLDGAATADVHILVLAKG